MVVAEKVNVEAEGDAVDRFNSLRYSVSVKNTFLDLDSIAIGDDDLNEDLDDLFKRTLTAPASNLFRQISSTPCHNKHGPALGFLEDDKTAQKLAEESDSTRDDSFGDDEKEEDSPCRLPHHGSIGRVANAEADSGTCRVPKPPVGRTGRTKQLRIGLTEASTDLSGLVDPKEWAKVSTVMMRNLPNKYTQRMLISELNGTSFVGTFDFIYLPIDPETNANKGYAFLNFLDPGFALMFRLHYEGRKMNRFNSSKLVSVTPGALQGYEANFSHYAISRVMRGHPSARPLFLREPGHRMNIPVASAVDEKKKLEMSSTRVRGVEVPAYAGNWQARTWSASSPGLAASPSFLNPYTSLGLATAATPDGCQHAVAAFCVFCRYPLRTSFAFCPGCGAKLKP